MDIWVMILRFMGDIPEPKPVEEVVKDAPKSLAKKLSGTLGRRFKQKEDLPDFVSAPKYFMKCTCS